MYEIYKMSYPLQTTTMMMITTRRAAMPAPAAAAPITTERWRKNKVNSKIIYIIYVYILEMQMERFLSKTAGANVYTSQVHSLEITLYK